MWFRTVSGLRWSSCAICSVERPSSSRRSTSACLGVRYGCGGRGGSSCSMSLTWPKTPITWPPLRSGTALTSTESRSPSAPMTTALLSEPADGPRRFRVKISRARRDSSGATTEVSWRPRTSPTSLRCWVHPADDPVAVDHVRGDTDPVDCIRHLVTKGLELGHWLRVWYSHRSGASSPRDSLPDTVAATGAVCL
jgi:hypothetical protein